MIGAGLKLFSHLLDSAGEPGPYSYFKISQYCFYTKLRQCKDKELSRNKDRTNGENFLSVSVMKKKNQTYLFIHQISLAGETSELI